MINSRHVLVLLIALFIAGGIVPPPSLSSEETVTLSFTRKAGEEETTRVYRVRPGDSLYRIIMKELSAAEGTAAEHLKTIQALNPDLADMDLIVPGQDLVLPVLDDEGGVSPSEPDNGLKTASASEELDGGEIYVVRPGDTVSSILNRTRGISYGEFMSHRAVLAAANRHIQDLNKIYPGQKMILPGMEEAAPPGRLASFSLSQEGMYAFLRDMFVAFGGDVITDGHYYVPLLPGQMTVDCSVVPVAEFSDGTRIMLDREGRIPPSVEEALRGRWDNYHVLSGMDGDAAQTLVDDVVRIRGAEEGYEKEGRLVSMGTGSEVTVFFDALIPVGRAGLPSSIDTLGIRLLQSADESLPLPLKSFINRQGIEVIELLEGEGPLATPASTGASLPLRLSGEGVGPAEDLLVELGYPLQRDARISVYRLEQDGFNLTVRAELLLETPGRRIVITARNTLLPFHDVLEEQGISVVTLVGDEGNDVTIRKLASMLSLPLKEDSPAFYLSPEAEARGERIQISALRLERDQGSVLFVEDDIDADLYRLLRERWKVNVVVY